MEKPGKFITLAKRKIFWHTDDLIDILKDLEFNHLNSILYRIYCNTNFMGEASQKYQILIELHSGSYIEDVVNQICSEIEYVLGMLEVNKFKKGDLMITKNLIMYFVRNWIYR